RVGDLLGEKDGEPYAGKEDEDSDQQQSEGQCVAKNYARSEELPILVSPGPDARGGCAESLGHGKHSDHNFPRRSDGLAERIFLTCDIDYGIVISLRGGEDSRGKRPAKGSLSPFGLGCGCAKRRATGFGWGLVAGR